MHCCRHIGVLAWLAFATTPLVANDLTKVERSLAKEPVYQSKKPKYGLLVFGPKAADRVWLVLDGTTLYVDRNGNGDLTEPGEKIAAKVEKARDPAEDGYSFEVGDVTVGGKVHKGLAVGFLPLAKYADHPSFANVAPLHAALKADPKALGAFVSVDVASDRFKGGGSGGRLTCSASLFDDNGIFQFADRPANAPIVHFDGPLQITFFGQRPTLKLQRENDLVLVVGTPGHGPGTFAALAYEDAIPVGVHPTVEIAWPAKDKGGPPLTQRYELKDRC